MAPERDEDEEEVLPIASVAPGASRTSRELSINTNSTFDAPMPPKPVASRVEKGRAEQCKTVNFCKIVI